MIKLTAIAGAGAVMPRPEEAYGGMFEAIAEKISQGIKGTIGKEVLTPLPVKGAKFAMVIDLGLCIGCRRCSYACKLENNVPDSINPPYIMVFETRYRPGQIIGVNKPVESHINGNGLLYTKLRKDRMYMPVQCNHCDDPP